MVSPQEQDLNEIAHCTIWLVVILILNLYYFSLNVRPVRLFFGEILTFILT